MAVGILSLTIRILSLVVWSLNLAVRILPLIELVLNLAVWVLSLAVRILNLTVWILCDLSDLCVHRTIWSATGLHGLHDLVLNALDYWKIEE